ncbi:hypothetical protein EJ06DRAFT_533655 [Trichodelitschia bisporula]|uniref:Secreted protein n=1 Tax=Trichodelitschia bisporula TaxID=703511 RepID=A0A6G1HLP8_9PEZI|nr:hypothetical protein EJ06DRAFT_533655 [Trichodelitschia bisporula]
MVLKVLLLETVIEIVAEDVVVTEGAASTVGRDVERLVDPLPEVDDTVPSELAVVSLPLSVPTSNSPSHKSPSNLPARKSAITSPTHSALPTTNSLSHPSHHFTAGTVRPPT